MPDSISTRDGSPESDDFAELKALSKDELMNWADWKINETLFDLCNYDEVAGEIAMTNAVGWGVDIRQINKTRRRRPCWSKRNCFAPSGPLEGFREIPVARCPRVWFELGCRLLGSGGSGDDAHLGDLDSTLSAAFSIDSVESVPDVLTVP
jgi:hypothetical protein